MRKTSHLWATLGLSLMLLTVSQSRVYGADPSVLLLSSNQAEAAGRHSDAIMGYQELLASGVQNAAIHYNLGIAHFKNSQLGAAIFHFYQASRLDPRDGDIRFNLEYARKKASDKIEDRRDLWVIYGSKYLLINSKEALYLSLLTVLLSVLISVIYVYYKNDLLRWALRLTLLLAFLSLAAYLGRFFIDEKMGVVTAKVADVYSGQGEHNVLLFTLHEGAEFAIEDQAQGGWLRIRLKDGKKGWIATTDVISEGTDSSSRGVKPA